MRGDLIIDRNTGIVLAVGTPDQIARLEELAQQLDRTEQARLTNERDKLKTDTERGTEDAQRQAADAQRRAAEADAREREERNEMRLRLRQEVMNTQTRILPVRYANVGPTTQTFQGQTVTIPGLDETLRTLLGIGDGKQGAAVAATAGTAAGLNDRELDELARIRREMGLVPPVISIDQRANAVIVRGTPSAIEEVEQLVARLDRPLPLVEIEVMIVRARRGVAEELGVRWGAAGVLTGSDGQFGGAATTGIAQQNLVAPLVSEPSTRQTSSVTDGTVSTNTVVNDLPPPSLNPLTLLPTALGGTIASFVFRGDDFVLQTQINALSQAQKLQTIAAPRVTTLNNLSAKITNDRTVYLAIPPAPNAPGGFQEVKAGLVLNITPSIIAREDTGEQGLIRLNINASDKDVTLALGRPTLSGNEVQTQVVIPNGATFVMGGLMNDARIEGTDEVPLLSDIPLVGELFRTRSSVSDLEETIFFITPRTIQPNDAYAQDIAQRRYLEGQRAKLTEMRQNVQETSQLISLNPQILEEDE